MAPLRFQNYDPADVPVETTRPPVRGATVRRAKTLTRPDRSVAPVPLINPQGPPVALPTTSDGETYGGSNVWRIFAIVVTFWAPSPLLSSLGGMDKPAVRQAWREKVALCIIITVLAGLVGFATVGTQKVLCPDQGENSARFVSYANGATPGVLGIQGAAFNASNVRSPDGIDLVRLSQISGTDITPYFQRPASYYDKCAGLSFRAAADEPCATANSCPLPALTSSNTLSTLNIQSTPLLVGYDWEQVSALPNYFVIDGAVLNMSPYLALHPNPMPSDNVDIAIRTMLKKQSPEGGKDGTRLFYYRQDLREAVPCLKQRYVAGNIDKITPGCFAANLLLYAGLIVILALVMIRFVMACIFNWFLSSRLSGPPDTRSLSKSAISPSVMPEGANVSIDNRNGTAPWAGGQKLTKKVNKQASSTTLVNDGPSPTMTLAQIGAELFTVCLVTCYSEGEESLRTTLDSISTTTYSDSRKLLFVVADGMITGAGETKSTPDICVGLLEADPRFGNPIPMAYNSIGTGSKSQNRAMIYAGHYTVAGRRTPTVMIIKCGTEQEAAKEKKPGNRGKRDSQLILMNFFSRVTYNDRMTPLDFDLFRKIHVLMGVTPDFFETCLMVDADTKVFPDSLTYLVNGMQHDHLIMGCCGETRIANKRQSWVTAIQVFEYFISHHLAKAFESVFGGVTCLPGCFSMFRLKARKNSGEEWVPIIIKPEIVKEYSQSEVTTLHQKNLLLLGEDRFLTTILLRTFPNRKMMFLPQARCRTIVPDTFSILLSQRRRWINSTIHNLMELVLVRNLCGTFCFSMQFVVFMDLLGTVVLPIAITLTYMLIIGMAINPPKSFEEAIPLALLIAVLGLPAILILLTTRKIVYVAWMFIYLAALPVWNFILPVYAFWHFDDFSWGETRKVEGEAKGEAHGEGDKVTVVAVPMRRWEDWERSRLRKLKREERRRREMERMHPTGYYSENDMLSVRGFDSRSQSDGSDAYSMTSSEDDHWGTQIGGYNENNTKYPPPPLTLHPAHADQLSGGEVLGNAELEAMLDVGYNDRKSPASSVSTRRYQLADHSTTQLVNHDYSPLSRSTSPTLNTALSPTTPTVNMSGGESYGPLGPLGPPNSQPGRRV